MALALLARDRQNLTGPVPHSITVVTASSSLTLSASDSELLEAFRNLSHPREVATLLDISFSTLTYWAYRAKQEDRYETFLVPKKGSGYRTISAPKGSLKILQRKLDRILRLIYRPKYSVKGFVKGGGIVRNAELHLRKRFVLNVDLLDFFDSINFGRVRGMLMAVPYQLPASVATILAQLCCVSPGLPQGGPTSPVLSNMLCAKLDAQLYRLARGNHCTYTRYADDLSFSTTRSTFPVSLASREEGVLSVGAELNEIIEGNGFSVNLKKVRLLSRDDRQEVTGIIVNEKLNVRRGYIRQTRAMLHSWEKWGLEKAAAAHLARYAKHRHPARPEPDFKKVVRGRVNYIGMVRGLDEEMYLKLRKRLANLASDDSWRDYRSLKGRLEEAVRVVESDDFQGTGFALTGVGFLTCSHILGTCSEVEVYASRDFERRIRAKVVVRDEGLDLAILEVAEPPGCSLLADDDTEMSQGTEVLLAGFPLQRRGDSLYIQEGVVTQVRSGAEPRFIVSAAIVGGTSGGPVLSQGRVVGIAVTGAESWEATSPGAQRTPFGVIPIRMVQRLVS